MELCGIKKQILSALRVRFLLKMFETYRPEPEPEMCPQCSIWLFHKTRQRGGRTHRDLPFLQGKEPDLVLPGIRRFPRPARHSAKIVHLSSHRVICTRSQGNSSAQTNNGTGAAGGGE